MEKPNVIYRARAAAITAAKAALMDPEMMPAPLGRVVLGEAVGVGLLPVGLAVLLETDPDPWAPPDPLPEPLPEPPVEPAPVPVGLEAVPVSVEVSREI